MGYLLKFKMIDEFEGGLKSYMCIRCPDKILPIQGLQIQVFFQGKRNTVRQLLSQILKY